MEEPAAAARAERPPGTTRPQGVCIIFLLKGGACKWGDKCHRRHLTPEDADARALRVGDGPGCITPRITDAITNAKA